MPTKRLDDSDRSQINAHINGMLARGLYNKKFPIEKDDWLEWGRSLLHEKAHKYWMYLRQNYPDLVREGASWSSSFKISDDEGTYYLNASSVIMPYDGIYIPKEHESYPEILAWAKWNYDLRTQIAVAQRYTQMCIGHCHSVGQVKRVLNEDTLRFVPEWLQKTLKDAERKSRVPAALELNEEKALLTANLLALGSISPQSREGVSVDANDFEPFATE